MFCVFRFIKLGHQPFDGVAMWGFNAPEWMFSTFAAMMAGGMAGGLYPTDTPETAAFKVAHSGVTWRVMTVQVWLGMTFPSRFLVSQDSEVALLQLLSRKCKCKGKHISNATYWKIASWYVSRTWCSTFRQVLWSMKTRPNWTSCWRRFKRWNVQKSCGSFSLRCRPWLNVTMPSLLGSRPLWPMATRQQKDSGHRDQSWGIEFHRIHRPWCWWVDACYTFIRLMLTWYICVLLFSSDVLKAKLLIEGP